MARRSGLGKGLDSLIPGGDSGGPTTEATGATLTEIPIGSITPNPHQPRVHFDEESIAELSASISAMGVLQPILVRRVEDGTNEIVAGERRWRAAQRAGLTVIPAIVRTTDDIGSMEQALVENLHREDLTPLEEAAAYQQLIDDFELTHEQVATRVGKSRAAITNTIRLLALPPTVQHLLADGQLSAGHGRTLLGTPDRARQEQLARQAVDEGWSVRALEVAVREGQTPTHETGDDGPAGDLGDGAREREPIDGAGLTPSTKLRPPGLLELENLLAEHLSTRVAIKMGAARGRVTIDFADLEDLERIYRLMT